LAQIHFVLEPAAALHDLLRRFLVLPEIRLGNACGYSGEFVVGAGGVKGSSAGPSRGARGLRICGAARRVARP
jgi:hypothetical protein